MKKLILSLAIASVPFASFADVLFNQASLDPDGYITEAYSSNGSYYYSQTEADDFTIAANSNVSSITFYGSSEYFLYDDLTNMTAFQIRILDSSFNPIFDQTVATAALNPTATGVLNGGDGIEYALTYTGNFNLAAGKYYLNVGAVLDQGEDDGFIWSLNTSPATHYFNAFDGSGFNTSSGGNFAFSLSGQPVPEPATMAALGLGLVAVARRKRK